MRAFVAVELSESIREALAGLIGSLRRLDLPVKWVAPENLHLTLKFLGNVPDETMTDVVGIVRRCTEGATPFELAVAGVGGFPSFQRPRVVFVESVESPPTLRELARCLNRRMTRAGVPRENRPFRSHITLGRVRRPRPIGHAARELEALGERSFGAMIVEGITLMKSDLTPDGPVYTPIERVALTAAPGADATTPHH